MEGVFLFPGYHRVLRAVLAHHAGEREGSCMGGVRAADATVLHHLLHMDSEPTIHCETEEVDVVGNAF